MGLDMYLTGTKRWYREVADRTEDGFPVECIEVHLGYWRKHQELHDWIVANIAGGVDDCQPISLRAKDIGEIIDALPVIYRKMNEHDDCKQQFARALAWLAPIGDRAGEENIKQPWLYVIYRASW